MKINNSEMDRVALLRHGRRNLKTVKTEKSGMNFDCHRERTEIVGGEASFACRYTKEYKPIVFVNQFIQSPNELVMAIGDCRSENAKVESSNGKSTPIQINGDKIILSNLDGLKYRSKLKEGMDKMPKEEFAAITKGFDASASFSCGCVIDDYTIDPSYQSLYFPSIDAKGKFMSRINTESETIKTHRNIWYPVSWIERYYMVKNNIFSELPKNVWLNENEIKQYERSLESTEERKKFVVDNTKVALGCINLQNGDAITDDNFVKNSMRERDPTVFLNSDKKVIIKNKSGNMETYGYNPLASQYFCAVSDKVPAIYTLPVDYMKSKNVHMVKNLKTGDIIDRDTAMILFGRSEITPPNRTYVNPDHYDTKVTRTGMQCWGVWKDKKTGQVKNGGFNSVEIQLNSNKSGSDNIAIAALSSKNLKTIQDKLERITKYYGV